MPTYLTHDNGGRPFKVVVSAGEVSVWKVPESDDSDKVPKPKDYTSLIARYLNPEKVFAGSNSQNERAKGRAKDRYGPGGDMYYKGNTILVKLDKHKYVHIGEKVVEFTTPDEITRYFSVVGNSDVPYPVAVGETNVYMMVDLRVVARSVFPAGYKDWVNCYGAYYGYVKGIPKIQGTRYGGKIKITRMVHKRIY